MTYKLTESRFDQSLIGSVDTTAKVEVGTILRAADPTYGADEFIYLKVLDTTMLTLKMDDLSAWVAMVDNSMTRVCRLSLAVGALLVACVGKVRPGLP